MRIFYIGVSNESPPFIVPHTIPHLHKYLRLFQVSTVVNRDAYYPPNNSNRTLHDSDDLKLLGIKTKYVAKNNDKKTSKARHNIMHKNYHHNNNNNILEKDSKRWIPKNLRGANRYKIK